MTVVSSIPQMLEMMQIAVYVAVILLAGSVAVLGFRIYAPFWKRMALRLVFGILALFSGIGLIGMLPIPDSLIFRMLQLDLWLGSMLAAIIFAIGLLLLSRSLSSEETLKRSIEDLQERLNRERHKHRPDHAFKSPFFIAGLLVIVALLIFAASNFRDMPSMKDDLLSTFGLTQEDLEALGATGSNSMASVGDMPSSCFSVLSVAAAYQDEMATGLQEYANPNLVSIIESETGSKVTRLMMADVRGTVIVVAMMDSGETCLATETEFCTCASTGTQAKA